MAGRIESPFHEQDDKIASSSAIQFWGSGRTTFEAGKRPRQGIPTNHSGYKTSKTCRNRKLEDSQFTIMLRKYEGENTHIWDTRKCHLWTPVPPPDLIPWDVVLAKLKSRIRLQGHNSKGSDKTEMLLIVIHLHVLHILMWTYSVWIAPHLPPLVLPSFCLSPGGGGLGPTDQMCIHLSLFYRHGGSMKEVKRKWARGGITESAGGWQWV